MLNPEERVRVYFQRNGKRYEMEGEVDRIGAQYAAIRPVGPLTEEAGIEVSVIDFSAGGALLQGSRKMLEFVLNRPIKAKEMSSEHPAHRDLLRRFKRQLIHFTFYPKLQFPNVAKRLHPRIPEKICLLGRVIRSEFVHRHGKEVFQHGIQFVHDAHYDAEAEGTTEWRPIKGGHGERHFNEIHAKLGRLSRFLESQNRDGGGTGRLTQEVRDDRVALVVNKTASPVEQRRRRANVQPGVLATSSLRRDAVEMRLKTDSLRSKTTRRKRAAEERRAGQSTDPSPSGDVRVRAGKALRNHCV